MLYTVYSTSSYCLKTGGQDPQSVNLDTLTVVTGSLEAWICRTLPQGPVSVFPHGSELRTTHLSNNSAMGPRGHQIGVGSIQSINQSITRRISGRLVSIESCFLRHCFIPPRCATSLPLNPSGVHPLVPSMLA